MTNAEYIRSMSDEELFVFLKGIDTLYECYCPAWSLCDGGRECEALLKWLKQPREVQDAIDADAVRIHRKNIEEAPAIDAVPVVHGRWITSGKEVCGDRQYFCSACNKEYWETQSWPKRANYCPNCGADMREENRE